MDYPHVMIYASLLIIAVDVNYVYWIHPGGSSITGTLSLCTRVVTSTKTWEEHWLNMKTTQIQHKAKEL